MSWWGKLLGGGFGFVIGGPIGALIGAAIGQSFDHGMQNLLEDDSADEETQQRIQMAFFTATFATMGHLAKADGKVTRDEIDMAEAVMEQMLLSAEQKRVAIDLFNRGKAMDYDLAGVIDQFKAECRRRTNLMRMFMEIQLQAAYADGRMDAAEEQLLKEICALLQFPDFVFRQMEALVRATHQRSREDNQRRQSAAVQGMTAAQAYEVLGVDRNADAAQVKRAYRRQMSQHHPDKLVARGLPPEMLKMATEQTQRIREAYDLIKARS